MACVIVETDRLAGSGRLSWSNVSDIGATLPTDDGGSVDVPSLDVVWWRRVNALPQIPPGVTDNAHRQLITGVRDQWAATSHCSPLAVTYN